jgi:hypothetical protein
MLMVDGNNNNIIKYWNKYIKNRYDKIKGWIIKISINYHKISELKKVKKINKIKIYLFM